MVRPTAVTAAIVASLLAVSGAGGVPAQTPKHGGTLVYRLIGSEPACLNILSECSQATPIIDTVLLKPFEIAPDFTYRPSLATATFTKKRPFTLSGASGFLLKDVPPEQLVAGIRAVATGDALLAPSITRRVVEEFVRRPPASLRTRPFELGDLTERELEVLKLVARGRSNAEIARELFVSEATVKTHVRHVLSKLGLRDRVQAVVLAYESGLIAPGES